MRCVKLCSNRKHLGFEIILNQNVFVRAQSTPQNPPVFAQTVAALSTTIAVEAQKHPGRGCSSGGLDRAPQRVLERRDWLSTFEDFPAAALTTFRFAVADVRQLAIELGPFLRMPRPGKSTYRAPVVDEANRVAALLAQSANPHIRLDVLAMNLGICGGAASKMLQWDRVNVVRALRSELPAIVHPEILLEILAPLGSMPNARVLVDTTDTKIQDLIGSFNVHHMLPSVKTLVFVDRDARLLGVETGWGGAESDISIFHQSHFYQQIAPNLRIGQRLFVGDGAFRDMYTFFPLSDKIDLKHATGEEAAAFSLYNRQLQLHRARVEHAIGQAKHHWGAIKEVPGIYHMELDDIGAMIFLSWLFEARWQRLNIESD